MTTINLAFQTPDYSAGEAPVNPVKPKMKEDYPSLTICDNKDLARALKPGQMITATVQFRVEEISIRDRDDDDENEMSYPGSSGTRVELEAQSMTIDNLKMDDSSGEEDMGSAMKKFMSKKKAMADDSGDE